MNEANEVNSFVSCDPAEIIMDYLYEEGNICFSIHDLRFWDYCKRRIPGLTENSLKDAIKSLVADGRLNKTRQYNEHTRPPGVPRWFYVYS